MDTNIAIRTVTLTATWPCFMQVAGKRPCRIQRPNTRRHLRSRSESLMHFVPKDLVHFDSYHRQLRLLRLQHCPLFLRLVEATEVIRNDVISVSDLVGLKPCAIVISPRPCDPIQAGISMTVVREVSGRVPILGTCLGHQCIGSVFGGRVARACRPMHGRSSYVTNDGRGLFKDLPSPLYVGRYHSLVVEFNESCAPHLAVTAYSDEGEVIALAHRYQPTSASSSIPNRY